MTHWLSAIRCQSLVAAALVASLSACGPAGEPPQRTASPESAANAGASRPPSGRCPSSPGHPSIKPQPPGYTWREDHDPNGIGKFYMGREIAHVMGYGPGGAGARWLERPEREKEENLSLLIKSLELKPDMVVADIGAGSGVISMRLARAVGPNGRVFAVDIQDAMLKRLKSRLKEHGVENVVPHKGAIKNPKLKDASIDLALLVDVYHELEFPYEMMLALSRSVKPGGRVVLVEYRKEDPKVPIKEVHKMTEAQVKKEIGLPEFGLKWKKTIDSLPWQHVVVFEKQRATTGR